jgi:creatinine amidohydrolase
VSLKGYSIFDETMVDMTWPQIQKAAEQKAIVLLPVGVMEEHGPHMGLASDIYISYLLCKFARRELETKGIKTLIAPPYYWGINTQTGEFPGSFTVKPETLKAMIYDILESLKNWGFTRVGVISLHGDYEHQRIIYEAVREAKNKLKIEAEIINPAPSYIKPFSSYDKHAGAFETGVIAHFFPNEVDVGTAKILETQYSFYPLGYWGDPAGFNKEEGKKYIISYSLDIANAIQQYLKVATKQK